MKNFFVALFIILFLFITSIFAQNKIEQENIELVATHFLNSSANQLSISSNLIATESLDKSKELYLKMAFDYDPTGESNAMMLLPANKIKSMTSAEVWDHMNKVGSTMEKLDMNIEWNIACLLYTSDAADERSSVDLGGRRIIKKKNKEALK